jgi:hypothetical protein
VQVVGEGQLFAEYASLGYPMHQVRGWRDASPVLVQAPSSLLGPGTADTRGRQVSYSLVVPPIVPVGSSVVVVSFHEPRPTRSPRVS